MSKLVHVLPVLIESLSPNDIEQPFLGIIRNQHPTPKYYHQFTHYPSSIPVMTAERPASSYWAWERQPADRRDFKVAIVCNFKDQFEAVLCSLDEVWADRSSGYGKQIAKICAKYHLWSHERL